jgi:predicted amidohydrolase YtcJ
MRWLAVLLVLGVGKLYREVADTIFINGNVHTVNDRQPHTEAIAVKEDRIAFVGSNADAQKFRGEKTGIMSGRT